jgi:cytochrome b
VAWGIAGPPEAHFARFVKGPSAVSGYVRAWWSGRRERLAGHNPAGGWMVVLMLLLLGLQAGTGLFSDDEIFTQGPLAAKVSSAWVGRLTAIHSYNQWLVAGAVAVHALGIAAYWLRYRENLTTTMGFGSGARDGSARELAVAAVLLGAAAAAVYLLVIVYPRG